MAIEDYTGVTKVDDYLYEVTGQVSIDVGNTLATGWLSQGGPFGNGETFAVGDMENATFIIKNGGFLRFCSGSASNDPATFPTFTKCTFIQTSTAVSMGSDRYFRGPGYQLGGVWDDEEEAPFLFAPGRVKFAGCTWIIDTNSVLDLTLRSHSYHFLTTADGFKNRIFHSSDEITAGGVTQWYPSSTDDVLQGIHFDLHYAVLWAGNTDDTDNFKNITIADKDPGNTDDANLSFQIGTWDPQYDNQDKKFYYLSGRSVGAPQYSYLQFEWTATEGKTWYSGTADYGGTFSVRQAIIDQTLYNFEGSSAIQYPWEIHVYINGVEIPRSGNYTLYTNALDLSAYGAANIHAGDVVYVRMDEVYRPQNRSINLIDPIGRIEKRTGVNEADKTLWNGVTLRTIGGILRLWRTYSGTFLDISTKTAVNECRTVITKDVDSSVQLDSTAGNFSVELMQFEQGVDTATVVEDNDYTAKFLAYGYELQTRGVTIEDTTDINAYDQGDVLLFQNTNVTERDRTVVDAYTELLTTPKIYDRIKSWEMTRPVSEFGTEYVTVTGAGDTLDFGDKDVYFGDFSGNMVTYFDSDYTAPGGSTVGDVSFTGYTLTGPTGVSSDDIFGIDRTTLTGAATWTHNIIAKDIDISPDGTTLLLVLNTTDSGGTYVVEFSLSTPFDLSTKTQTNVARVSTSVSQYKAVKITNGKYVFMYNDSSGAWEQAEFATAFDTTSAVTLTSGTGLFNTYDGYDGGCWSYDGSYFYKFRNLTSALAMRIAPCSTPFDITTRGSVDYQSISTTDLRGDYNSTYGGNQYQRWNGVSMKWIDSDTVFIASGYTGKYTIIHPATPNKLVASDFTGATIHSIPNVGTDGIGWATLAGTHLVSFMPGVAAPSGTTILNYSLDHCTVGGSYDLIGAPNSLFIQANGDIVDGGSDFTTMKTTGYFNELNDANINTQTQDATGVGTTVTIKGINPGTEVRMYRVSDDSEIAGIEDSVGTQTSLAYNFVSPEETYIVIHNTQYNTSPNRIAFTTQSAAATLTVFQQLDRAYRNPL